MIRLVDHHKRGNRSRNWALGARNHARPSE
jgi:hypothetical protein